LAIVKAQIQEFWLAGVINPYPKPHPKPHPFNNYRPAMADVMGFTRRKDY
jgi:hypothetical protein